MFRLHLCSPSPPTSFSGVLLLPLDLFVLSLVLSGSLHPCTPLSGLISRVFMNFSLVSSSGLLFHPGDMDLSLFSSPGGAPF